MFDFSGLHILVVGDCMLDQYIHGDVNRISPEAPVPVLEELERETKLGGAVNVAANLVELGASVSIIGISGDDPQRELMLSLLDKSGINSRISIDTSRPTTVKTRLLAQNQQLMRVDKESVHPISSQVTADILESINTLLTSQKIDYVILQDYNKGVLHQASIPQIIDIVQSKSIKICVDPKFQNLHCYKGVDFIKPNLREAVNILNVAEEQFLNNLEASAKAIVEMLDVRSVWVTLGDQGICCYTEDGKFTHSPTLASKIVDVCGAGDAVISILAMLHHQNRSIDQMAKMANIVGGIVCSKPGVATVSIKEINQSTL